MCNSTGTETEHVANHGTTKSQVVIQGLISFFEGLSFQFLSGISYQKVLSLQ